MTSQSDALLFQVADTCLCDATGLLREMQASDGGTGDVRERLRLVAADLHAVAAE